MALKMFGNVVTCCAVPRLMDHEDCTKEIGNNAYSKHEIKRPNNQLIEKENKRIKESMMMLVQIRTIIEIENGGTNMDIIDPTTASIHRFIKAFIRELQEKIDELAALGFTVVWLPLPTESISPEFVNALRSI
ncbi:hypothetical protein LXL04_037597 [Taraxacum kok-saghyz]